jgi:hypothetical protein
MIDRRAQNHGSRAAHMAAFMKPSPFLVRIEDAVKPTCRRSVNLDDVATKMSDGVPHVFFPLLELPGIGSGGKSGGGAAAAPGEASRRSRPSRSARSATASTRCCR